MKVDFRPNIFLFRLITKTKIYCLAGDVEYCIIDHHYNLFFRLEFFPLGFLFSSILPIALELYIAVLILIPAREKIFATSPFTSSAV